MGLFSRKKKVEEVKDIDLNKSEDMKTINVSKANDTEIVKYDGNNNEIFEKFSMNNLRYDAKVVVPATHSVIIIKDGTPLPTMENGIYNIFDTKKKEKLDSVVDVIFVSKTAKLLIKWGTRNQFKLRDVETNVPIRIGANGEMEIGVENPRKFYLEVVGADSQFSIDNLKERLILKVVSVIEPIVAREMRDKGISYEVLSEYKSDIASEVSKELKVMLSREYGLKLYSFIIGDMIMPKECLDAVKMAKAELMKELKQDREMAMAREDRDANDARYDKYLDTVKAVGRWENEEVEERHCWACGEVVGPNDNFCPFCGEKVEDEVICPNCGKPNRNDVNFCSKCGYKF